MAAPQISLEQWLAFKTVVDQGSYAAAAEHLNKSQSTVSYAVSRLNDQLPEPVLQVRGRRAELTDTGKVLYRHAEQLLRQAVEAESVARSLAHGVEAEVTLALDSLMQIDPLLPLFDSFSQQFPNTRLRVLETTLSGTQEALLEKQADLVIGAVTPVGYSGPIIRQINMVPVAAPQHALVKNRDQVSELELRGYRQVVLRDTGTRREQDAGWLQAEKRWTVSHFSTSIQMLKAGLAFGFLPEDWVRSALAEGSLKRIPLQQTLERRLPLYLMLADRQAAGPATRALNQLIADAAAPPL